MCHWVAFGDRLDDDVDLASVVGVCDENEKEWFLFFSWAFTGFEEQEVFVLSKAR